VETAPCQQCHDPHASARTGLFREQLHPPFESGRCTGCHALPGSERPFETKIPIGKLCGDCHEEQAERSANAPFPHVSAGGGDCQVCHNPHTAEGSGLLKQPLQSLCLSCHDPAGSSSGWAGRFQSHGGDLGCGICHEPHGSDYPVLMANTAMDTCNACHEHQHNVAHPQGEEVLDPRSGQPLDCLSCHGIHDAPHKKYLHREGDRELCISCHKSLGRRDR
jgi:predicted CXXCH cytochrome family protein